MCVNAGRGYIWGSWEVYRMTHVGCFPVGWVSVAPALSFFKTPISHFHIEPEVYSQAFSLKGETLSFVRVELKSTLMSHTHRYTE